jgi:Putative auto-transporter adhesin, head GIN domain
MHKRFITHVAPAVLLAAAMLLAACCVPLTTVGSALSGSGKLTTREHAVEGFTGIDARNGFNVTVTGGDAFKVAITTDDNVQDAISVKKVGDTLQLGVDSSKAQSVHTTRLEAAITMPELKDVSLDSGSRLTVADSSPRGTALKLTQKAGSHSDLSAMPVQTAEVALDAGSSADINVTGKLDYQLRAGSQLRYTGNPTIGTSRSLDGSSATQY